MDVSECLTIGVQYKSNRPHTTVRQLLLELVTRFLKPIASRLNVIDRDTYMSEALWILVAVVDGIVVVLLGAIYTRSAMLGRRSYRTCNYGRVPEAPPDPSSACRLMLRMGHRNTGSGCRTWPRAFPST
jgi:hypothetical protein